MAVSQTHQQGVLGAHPQRKWILDQLDSGVPYREIASKCKPRVSITTLTNLRKQQAAFLDSATAIAQVQALQQLKPGEQVNSEQITEAVRVLTSNSVKGSYALTRLNRRAKDLDKAMKFALEQQSGKDVAQLVGAEVRLLELQCKIDGTLQPDGPRGVSINLILPNRAETPAKDSITIDVSAAPSSSDA